MKLLLDVNVEKAIVTALRAEGHEAVWLAEHRSRRHLPDEALLRYAYRDEQVVITNDTGFVRHVFTDHLPAHGIVLLRVAILKAPHAQRTQRALEALHAYLPRLMGQFTTIYPDRVEQRPLPAPPASPPLPHP